METACREPFCVRQIWIPGADDDDDDDPQQPQCRENKLRLPTLPPTRNWLPNLNLEAAWSPFLKTLSALLLVLPATHSCGQTHSNESIMQIPTTCAASDLRRLS